MEADEASSSPDADRSRRLADGLAGSRAIFDGLLADGPFLIGSELTAADVCAFPFLKWATLGAAPADAPRFEHILVEHLALGDHHARLRAWIERMGELPRA